MNKKKKTRKVFQIIILLLAIACLVCLLFAVINISKQSKQSDDESKIDNVNDLYVVPSNVTDYQRELYEELTNTINSINDIENDDLSELAGTVAKNFIADFFSWGNKRGSYDVGGIDFVYGPLHMNFSFGARDGYYSDLDLLMKEYGKENLPIVSYINIESVEHQDDKYKVTIQVHDYEKDIDYEEYEYYDAYLVIANWNYEKPADSKYDDSKLPNSGNFMLILRDGRLEIGYYHEDWIRGLNDE